MSVETSSRYSVAPVTDVQLAVNPVAVIEVAALAVGVRGNVTAVITFELTDVPETLAARTR